MRQTQTTALIFGVIMAAILTALMFAELKDCKQRGGALVQGAFWYECVMGAGK